MNYCKVVAILNITDFGQISTSIQKLDIPGVTVSKVKGFGDYINEFNEFGFSDNIKVEVYTSAEQAEIVADTLSNLGNEMTEGGGLVAIEPVNKLLNVRKLESQ
jgi:nitrogen regulatory protein P-II 1